MLTTNIYTKYLIMVHIGNWRRDDTRLSVVVTSLNWNSDMLPYSFTILASLSEGVTVLRLSSAWFPVFMCFPSVKRSNWPIDAMLCCSSIMFQRTTVVVVVVV